MTHTHTTARPVSIIVEVVHGISICSPMFTELQERETLAEHAKRGDVVAVYVVELTSLDVPALRSSWRERRGLALVESANAPTLAERRAGHPLPMSARERDA